MSRSVDKSRCLLVHWISCGLLEYSCLWQISDDCEDDLSVDARSSGAEFEGTSTFVLSCEIVLRAFYQIFSSTQSTCSVRGQRCAPV